MLKFELTRDPQTGNRILEVVETLHSFRGTARTFWYYDIDAWRQSSTGKKGAALDRDCSPLTQQWVRTHHFKHVGLNFDGTAVNALAY